MAEKIAHTFHPEKLDNEPEWSAVEVTEDIVVEDKYQGTSVDRSEMRMLGRIQVLRTTDEALCSAISPLSLCLASVRF
ncbi:MAG: hypothetical protein Q9213_002864 [Squamulea squamosa]